jgi:hypothetical protein
MVLRSHGWESVVGWFLLYTLLCGYSSMQRPVLQWVHLLSQHGNQHHFGHLFSLTDDTANFVHAWDAITFYEGLISVCRSGNNFSSAFYSDSIILVLHINFSRAAI